MTTHSRIAVTAENTDDLIVTGGQRVARRLPDLVVAGIPEAEIFAMAPVMRCDRVYWSTEETCDPRDICAILPTQGWTRQWSDGTHRIWVASGEGSQTREVVRSWCQERGIEPFNLRVETDVAFRDVSLIPEHLRAGLVAECVDWLYPHTTSIQRRLVAELPGIDEGDVRGMMYLFVHDLLDRFDSDRQGRNGSLNFTAFALGKMRTWPQDAARAIFGRVSVNDRVAFQRSSEELTSRLGRTPTEFERADALGMTVTDLRSREQAVAGLLNARYADPILGGGDDEAVDVADADVDVADAALDSPMKAALTAAIMSAVYDPEGTTKRSVDPLGLAVLYLMYWDGLTRAEIAEQLGVLPKTVTAAIKRTMRDIDVEALA